MTEEVYKGWEGVIKGEGDRGVNGRGELGGYGYGWMLGTFNKEK